MKFLNSKEYWLGLTVVNVIIAIGLDSLPSSILAAGFGAYTLYLYNNETK